MPLYFGEREMRLREHGENKVTFVPALRFGWFTPAYDGVVRWTVRESTFKRALSDQADVRRGDRVLDLGCGTGTLALRIAAAVPDAVVTGVDADPTVLEIARKKGDTASVRLRLDRARAEELPYPDSSFDCVVSSLFFHHLPRSTKRRALAEVLRVLVPGGRFHVADWGRGETMFDRLLFLPVRALDGFDNTRENAEGTLMGLVRESGFECVAETRRLRTAFGTVLLFRAIAPHSRAGGTEVGR